MKVLCVLLAALAGAMAQQPEPIIFVHGNGDDATKWIPVIWLFESNGYPANRLFAIRFTDPVARRQDSLARTVSFFYRGRSQRVKRLCGSGLIRDKSRQGRPGGKQSRRHDHPQLPEECRRGRRGVACNTCGNAEPRSDEARYAIWTRSSMVLALS